MNHQWKPPWNMNDLMHIIEYLNIKKISDVTPEWLPTPAFMIERISEDGSIVQDCGKGLKLLDAFYSAVFESIERSAAESSSHSRFIKGSYNGLKDKHSLCAPSFIYPQKLEANDLALSWMSCKDLLTGNEIYLPADCIYFPYDSSFFNVTTVGLAANSSMTRAILHAIFEIIEHDTLSTHIYTGLPGREIILSGDNEPLLSIYEAIKSEGIKIKVKLLDNNMRISTVICLFEEIPRMPGIKVAGIGTHFDPFISARRAITECCQSTSFWFQRYQAGDMEEKIIHHPPLYYTPKYASMNNEISLNEIEGSSTQDDEKTLEHLLDKLRGNASHVILADLTRPDFPAPCVKIFIPNFEDLLTSSETRGRAELIKNIVDEYIKKEC